MSPKVDLEEITAPIRYVREMEEFIAKANAFYGVGADENAILRAENTIYEIVHDFAERLIKNKAEPRQLLSSNLFKKLVRALEDVYEIAYGVAEQVLKKDPHSKLVEEYVRFLPYGVEYYPDDEPEGPWFYNTNPAGYQTMIAEFLEGLTGMPVYVEEDLAREDEYPIVIVSFWDDSYGNFRHILDGIEICSKFNDCELIVDRADWD